MEVHVYAEELVSLLRLEFSFSATTNTPFKNPDALLIASVVLAVKLLYPFSKDGRQSTTTDHRPSLRGMALDWQRWAEIYRSHQEHHTEPGCRFEKTNSSDVYDMTGEDMDRYLDWYQETQITAEQGLCSDSSNRQGRGN